MTNQSVQSFQRRTTFRLHVPFLFFYAFESNCLPELIQDQFCSQSTSLRQCRGSLQTYSEELVHPECGGAEHEADEDQSEELVSVELQKGLVCRGQREGRHEIKRWTSTQASDYCVSLENGGWIFSGLTFKLYQSPNKHINTYFARINCEYMNRF